MEKNTIGLRIEDSTKTTELLNQLLADHQIYYQNLRGFHWLVVGKSFYQLHELFENLYNEVGNTIDELAERVLMLGEIPLHTYEDYVKQAELKVVSNLRDGDKIMAVVSENVSYLLNSARKTLSVAAEGNDEGTVSMMSGLISAYEKQLWMISTYTFNID